MTTDEALGCREAWAQIGSRALGAALHLSGVTVRDMARANLDGGYGF